MGWEEEVVWGGLAGGAVGGVPCLIGKEGEV